MSHTPDSLIQLIQALRCLPGVGPRSAERLAYHLLQTPERSLFLSKTLQSALETIKKCERCNHYTQTALCSRCRDLRRDQTVLCVVETPQDLLAIEQSGVYQGSYYVLLGRISPLDGVGPEELNLSKLFQIAQQESVSEVILALSPTVEGQTTLHCIQSLLSPLAIRLSQLAQGIPLGGELASLDSSTIGSALRNRAALSI